MRRLSQIAADCGGQLIGEDSPWSVMVLPCYFCPLSTVNMTVKDTHLFTGKILGSGDSVAVDFVAVDDSESLVDPIH